MRGLRGVGSGRMQLKLSSTYRLGATPPNYAEARPFNNDNAGAALRFSVRLNLCIHATLSDLEALNLLRGGKVRRQQQRHTDDGALRKIARRAQCNFGPLRNLARSEEFTLTSKVTPSR